MDSRDRVVSRRARRPSSDDETGEKYFIASSRRVTVRRATSRVHRARTHRATSRGAAALAMRARTASRDDARARCTRDAVNEKERKRTWAKPALTANVPRSVSVDIAFVDVH